MPRNKVLAVVGIVLLPVAASFLGCQKKMPYGDLLDKASEKYGFKFHYEKWSDWEKQVSQYISDYLEKEREGQVILHGGEDTAARHDELLSGYLLNRYKELWTQGVPLADAPLAKDLAPPKDGTGTTLHTERKTWDDNLGDWRVLEPTIYVDLSYMTIYEGGGLAYNQDAIRSEDGAPQLSDEERHRLLHRGYEPVGVKVVYIGEDGQKLPSGEIPAPLDPTNAFDHVSDEELHAAVKGAYEFLVSPTPEQEKIIQEMLNTPTGRMMFEDALYGLMAEWSRRSSAWGVKPQPQSGFDFFKSGRR